MSSVVRQSKRPVVILTSLILAMVAGSCGKAEQAEEAKEPAEHMESTTPPETSSQPAPDTALTDAKVAAIVVAANTIDIRNGKMANARSNNPAVKAFGTQMISDATAANKEATDLSSKLGMTPEASDISHQLVEDADRTRDRIEAMKGADFDKGYIDNEVAFQQAVIDMLDATLIPRAANAELKALLQRVKPAFEAHLDHARHVQAALLK